MKTKPESSTKVRPLGDILLDMEPFIQEAMDNHDLQWGDFLSLMYGYLMVHYPMAQEEYESGGNPVFFYGHKKAAKKFFRKNKGKQWAKKKKRRC